MSEVFKCGLAAVVDPRVRLLLLGSLPGDCSLKEQQYYAHPRNYFWKLMSAVLDIDLISLDYPTRLQTLLDAGIGLWDVIAKAHRQGSLDGQIRTHTQNDLLTLLAALPALRAIAFNGGTAARIGLKALQDQHTHYQIMLLPSSSPAYTLAYEKKLIPWLAIRKWAYQ